MTSVALEVVNVLAARQEFARWIVSHKPSQSLGTVIGGEMRAQRRTTIRSKNPKNPAIDAGVGFLRLVWYSYATYGKEATRANIRFWCVQPRVSFLLRDNVSVWAQAFYEVATKLEELKIPKDFQAFDVWGGFIVGRALERVQEGL